MTFIIHKAILVPTKFIDILMTFFIVLSFSLIALFSYFTFRAWSQNSPLMPSQNPEWEALVAKRDEIEQDQAISESTRETLRAEWLATADQVLAKNQNNTTQSQAITMPKSWGLYLGTGAAVIGIITYLVIGQFGSQAIQSPQMTQADISEVSAEPPPADGAKHPGDSETLEERIAKLEQKLKENPDDIDRWVLLARSRGVQRDYAGEADALKQALRLSPGHPDLMADLADTLAMLNNKSLAGEPSKLVAEVLKADPEHRKGLALAATEAMQKHDKKASIVYWQRLRATFPAGAPDLARIDEILAEIGAPMLADTEATPTPAATGDAVAGASITGEVVLDKKLLAGLSKQAVPESAVLYVFAKMVSGSPMPLAVMRVSPKSLLAGEAIPFKLDDSMAMSPAMKLSGSPQVNLEARLSMSGNAIKQPGDLSVVLPAVKVGTQGLHLLINSKIQ